MLTTSIVVCHTTLCVNSPLGIGYRITSLPRRRKHCTYHMCNSHMRNEPSHCASMISLHKDGYSVEKSGCFRSISFCINKNYAFPTYSYANGWAVKFYVPVFHGCACSIRRIAYVCSSLSPFYFHGRALQWAIYQGMWAVYISKQLTLY
jgi:hypothetical protein